MFRGYFGDAKVTMQAFTPDGWLKTGDLASRNADGTIAYRGRYTEFINRGGLKFSAVEVESLLVDLPALDQFAVIAREDERLGQRSLLVASVRPGYNISLADVTAHLASKNLARYKWPEELIMVEELPATPTGKIARVRLAELLSSKLNK
jgi:non-ribosomal peptide synthetase component E (peptide arylation enzyme)